MSLTKGMSQDSGVANLVELVGAGDGGSVGVARIEDADGPWVVSVRYSYDGGQAGPGIFLNPLVNQVFGFIRVREGRQRAQKTWDYPRDYFILRDLTIQSNANALDVSVIVPPGLVGPFAAATIQAWVTRGPVAQHEWSGLLAIAANLVGLQAIVNGGFDASVPRGATSFWLTLPTFGDAGGFGAMPPQLDIYQLDAYGNPVQVNRIVAVERNVLPIALSQLTRFVGAVDPAGFVGFGSVPITWVTHG